MNEQPRIEDPVEAGAPVEIDRVRLEQFLMEVRDGSNLFLGGVAGLIAAAVGAGVWAAISASTGFQIGWMAVGVGFLVGFAVRMFGKGIDRSFGLVGGGLALLGCLAGNLLTIVVLVSQQEGIAVLDLLSRLNPAAAAELMMVTFSPIDLLFYGIAVYEGYRFSFRPVTPEEIAGVTK